jgi:hypothetical protein
VITYLSLKLLPGASTGTGVPPAWILMASAFTSQALGVRESGFCAIDAGQVEGMCPEHREFDREMPDSRPHHSDGVGVLRNQRTEKRMVWLCNWSFQRLKISQSMDETLSGPMGVKTLFTDGDRFYAQSGFLSSTVFLLIP